MLDQSSVARFNYISIDDIQNLVIIFPLFRIHEPGDKR